MRSHPDRYWHVVPAGWRLRSGDFQEAARLAAIGLDGAPPWQVRGELRQLHLKAARCMVEQQVELTGTIMPRIVADGFFPNECSLSDRQRLVYGKCRERWLSYWRAMHRGTLTAGVGDEAEDIDLPTCWDTGDWVLVHHVWWSLRIAIRSPEAIVSDRLPPQHIPSERAVLGALILGSERLAEVAGTLRVEEFYRQTHREIYGAILRLFERGEPVDLVTLTPALGEAGLARIGGTGCLTELIDEVFSDANIEHYGAVIKEKAVLRNGIQAAREITELGYQDQITAEEWLDQAEQRVFELSRERIASKYVSAQELMASSLATVEMQYGRKEAITGIPSGYRDLDRITAGFQRADLIILAGRPSMGKTAFALDLAMNAAIDNSIPTAMFSLEMNKEQIGLRMLCARAHVNAQNMRTGTLSQRDWGQITTAIGGIAAAPIYIDDSPGLTPLELRAKARRLVLEHNIGLILIDYLQLMSANHRSDSREREISEISRSLKALAKELNIPVIALSQLNRKVEERSDKRPMVSDLRESGAIEQDADVIMFVFRPVVYERDRDEMGVQHPLYRDAEIIVGKQRNGPIGTVRLTFEPGWSTFLSRSLRDQAA